MSLVENCFNIVKENPQDYYPQYKSNGSKRKEEKFHFCMQTKHTSNGWENEKRKNSNQMNIST